MRRLLRESYRLNKLELLDAVKLKNVKLKILISLTPKAYSNYKDVKFQELSGNMSVLLSKVNALIP